MKRRFAKCCLMGKENKLLRQALLRRRSGYIIPAHGGSKDD